MNQKRIFLIGGLLYGGAALFFLAQNVLSVYGAATSGERIKKENAVAENSRAALRAFYTAPPVIPHEVESGGSRNCLDCHVYVTKLGEASADMQIPHPQFFNCLQCHAPSLPGGNQQADNVWEGLEEPIEGTRWSLASPPTIPHRIFLRGNCLSCHGPQNPDMRLKTPHPERASCLQCHAPDHNREF